MSPSSFAICATPSGIPMPRFTMLYGLSSKAARLAINFLGPISMGGIDAMGILISQLYEGL